MAQNERAIEWTRKVLKRTDLTPEARGYHEERLRSLTESQPQASSPSPAPSPKPPRAAAKKASATPPSDAQRAAPRHLEAHEDDPQVGGPEHLKMLNAYRGRKATGTPNTSPPAASHAAAYTAAHAHLHENPAPAAKPAAKPHTPIAHSAEQMQVIAGYHEQQQRAFAQRGDSRGAEVHGQKAAAMRKALEAHARTAGTSAPAAPGNSEHERHLEDASHHRHLANRAGVARSAAAADVLEAKHEAERLAADPNVGKHHAAYHAAVAQIAAHRERVAQHANVEKAHFADEKLALARAKQAKAIEPEAKKRAENEALAAHARADQAKEAVRGGHARIGIAQIHTQNAANPASAPSGHGGHDPLERRRRHIEHASKEFRALLETGSNQLIEHMHRQVGH